MSTNDTRMNKEDEQSDLPKLSNPALRALAGAGYHRLEQLSKTTEKEIMKLHGMGPKSLDPLRRALAEKGLTFADES
ncbi:MULTISPECIES: DNA-directed RNA polymerase subunit alpha C-terminal domain-containing protein [Paenibacillus]|uniref:DNA-directed RNA polymerase subunit alpha C-terminal domain-containing protein n=1 Tax=Paenibacillus violae TaxID=3077234 RepID=A0ABU3RDF5_9BACL|nr:MULTISPECIES: DNA-directed RNA polymerase subunit alpha C-terminal domain-containing protein [Paenibacillus]MDU0202280.1 DNA-directed RNA polymerase subunit alpha C-terminal domain-containing protein [Paenibacillus sp. PFR10]MEC0264689.1 DNA-directed RNA polymerase subunit alpha C-terminal domain-containing protein [Paenibacillus anseongense]